MDSKLVQTARGLLTRLRGTAYVFGTDVLGEVGPIAAELGKNALVVGNTTHTKSILHRVIQSLYTNGLLVNSTLGARPNTPIEDVYRIASKIQNSRPDLIVAVGGGSTIDAVKAAVAVACLGGEVERFFGTGLVGEALKGAGSSLIPIVAVPTIAGSGAHLTKYANVTDLARAQKKLIVDEVLVPARSVFDYDVTLTAALDITVDGILDGMSHLVEVFFGTGAANSDQYSMVEQLVKTGVPLIVKAAGRVLANPDDRVGRAAIGLATDLGACAIMIGGTNGPHLNSFSLVDVASHGRACGILNPYYAVLFASAIEPQLQVLGRIYAEYGLILEDLGTLAGRDLALAVARGMQRFMQSLGVPVSLKELPGFGENHLERILTAAKDSQLRMKLKNMPVPITPRLVDDTIGSVLKAAYAGDLRLVHSL